LDTGVVSGAATGALRSGVATGMPPPGLAWLITWVGTRPSWAGAPLLGVLTGMARALVALVLPPLDGRSFAARTTGAALRVPAP